MYVCMYVCMYIPQALWKGVMREREKRAWYPFSLTQPSFSSVHARYQCDTDVILLSQQNVKGVNLS